MRDDTIIIPSTTQYERMIRRAFWKGAIFGCAITIVMFMISAEAHTPCEQECGYVTEIDLETGEVTHIYKCE